MTNNVTRCVLFASALAAVAAHASLASADPNVDRSLAAQCAQCHGTNGYAVGEIDSLAGKNANELYKEFLSLKRDSDTEMMHLQARGYTDRQLRRIADYFSSLPTAGDLAEQEEQSGL